MLNPYVYSVSADMPSGAINEGKLHAEIVNSAIATTLNSIRSDMNVLTITFTGDLSAGDKTILDGDTSGPAGGLLAAHDNSASGPANALRYLANAGQSIPDATQTTIDFEEHDFGDADGNVTIGADWEYTVPVAGVYRLHAFVEFVSADWVVNELFILYLFVEGVLISTSTKVMTASFTGIQNSEVNELLNLAAGDLVHLQVSQNTGGAVALAAANRNRIDIVRETGPP